MARLRIALVSALGALLLMPQAAVGGGWWSSIRIDRSVVTPGQRVELSASVAFRSAAAAAAAERTDRFSVYLLRGFDDSVVQRAMRTASPGDWWSPGDAEAIAVGRVSVDVVHANLAGATAAFTVPDLPQGTYDVMLCDAGCRNPLPDVIPTGGFTVVADPATARVAARIDGVERSARQRAGQLAEAQAGIDEALITARNARMDLERLEARVAALANADRDPAPASPWAYAGWLVAGALAGALVLLVLRGRRRRRTSTAAGWGSGDPDVSDRTPERPAGPGADQGVLTYGPIRPISQDSLGRRAARGSDR